MHISSLLKDRRRTPLQETCDWIEYILRHGGARHLRPQVLDIPWYQYYLLDVIAFIVAVATTVVMSIRLACRCLCRVCCRKGDNKTKKDWKLGQIRQRRIQGGKWLRLGLFWLRWALGRQFFEFGTFFLHFQHSCALDWLLSRIWAIFCFLVIFSAHFSQFSIY